MTALRPERESSSYGGEAAYGGAEAFEGAEALASAEAIAGAQAFEAAVEQLADPLTDPLPGQRQSAAGQQPATGQQPAPGQQRIPLQQPAAPLQQTPPQQPAPVPGTPQQQEWYDPEGYAHEWYAAPEPTRPREPAYEEPVAAPYVEPVAPPYRGPGPMPYEQPRAAPAPLDDETVALRVPESIPVPPRIGGTAGTTAGSAAVPAPGGRAARRKAARRHGRHGGPQESLESPESQETLESAERGAEAPLTRMEARRAERARKPGAAVIVSRMIGEVFITTGVLMLLFVTYQLWWSNVRAHQQADKAANNLQQDWATGKGNPGTFEPGQGFAILHIPKLDVVTPIAEGTSKSKVLDRGMVGHYAEGSLKTAMPDAKTGNFALAGHRNTHGEPFRYINKLEPGDEIVVETQDDYFVYKMTSILPVTSPSNTAVIDPVPKGSGFTEPGRYITLTTCTPEFTSKYRMIVWGKMVEDRPRSEGKPEALVQ
ncbi:class E sortase [Streptomyces sp. NBC_00243]|uniref:class E sortase n=1 Tax=Streptomyces sp. NBC_00243 TaxID=2975688 RepID=UPI002DDA5FAF|nr:class E sortase [Streptomyces sp. NBC_00243]WRZ21216.1 class E sortase [Streptomyces sp. NBC_00243]